MKRKTPHVHASEWVDLSKKRWKAFVVPADPGGEYPTCWFGDDEIASPFLARPLSSFPRATQVERIQELVGGYFESVPLRKELHPMGWGVLYVHEEGALLPLPFNRNASAFTPLGPIFGDAVVVREARDQTTQAEIDPAFFMAVANYYQPEPALH